MSLCLLAVLISVKPEYSPPPLDCRTPLEAKYPGQITIAPPTTAKHHLQPPCHVLHATKPPAPPPPAYVGHRINSDPFCLPPLHSCLEQGAKRWGAADGIE